MPMSGKYFFIKNKSNNLYLDACGLTSNPEKISPGNTQVTLWKKRQTPKEEVKNSQVWYWDALTSTLRNTLYGLCLDVNENKKAVINFLDIHKSIEHKKLGKKDTKIKNTMSILGRYSPLLRRFSSSSSINVDKPSALFYSQQWKFNKLKGAIESVENEDVVLDVVSSSQSSGIEACISHFCNKSSQIWMLEHIPIRYFYIFSKFLSGNVLDVLGGKMSAGAKVGLYVKRKNDKIYNSQLWFEDENGNIRNKLNDKLVLHATGISLKTEQPDQTRQRWVVCGNRVVSADDHSTVISLGKKRHSYSIDDHDTYYLCSSTYLGSDSQHWDFLYV